MTNGGIIFFKNNEEKKKFYLSMSKFEICGYKLFQVKNLTKKSIFYKIAIKSLSKDLNYKNVIYNIDYYDKHKFKRKTINFKNFELFRNFKFIKTTGTHVNSGFLMTHNFSKIKRKKIRNHEIYYLIKNFLNV